MRLALVLIVAACASAGRVPKPGDRLPPNASPVAVVHRGGDLCIHGVMANGIRFSVDVECGREVIVFVQTEDEKFVTPEGVRVGQTLRDAVRAGGQVAADDGECRVKLPSGWDARPSPGSETKCGERLGEVIRFLSVT